LGVRRDKAALSSGCKPHPAHLGIRTSLTPRDTAAIRFAVSGSLLLPYTIRKGLALERLGWTGLAAVVAGCGAPMVLLANAGLPFAPAAHAGALFPGVTPLMVAMLAAAVLREAFTSQKRIGCTLILMGAIGIVGQPAAVEPDLHRLPRDGCLIHGGRELRCLGLMRLQQPNHTRNQRFILPPLALSADG
jgi:multidrug transporter EmrE-like cation transporter